jgi:hypothetical protein
MKKALIVKTKTGQKGYVYYDKNTDLQAEKLQVNIIDDKFNETGENLLCAPSGLTAIGYKD